MAAFYNTSLPGQFVIVAGHPTQGLDVIGPFYSEDHAEEWGNRNVIKGDWWIVPLNVPYPEAA